MSNSWNKIKLSALCEVFTDGDWIETKHQSSDGIRLIQTGNIGIGNFKNRKNKARYISNTTFNKLNCTGIFENDCLVSRLPDPVGRTCIIPDTNERMITAVDCTIIRFNENKIIPEYFNYYSQSLQYLEDVDKKTSGATRKRISRKNLGDIIIPFPQLPEQKRIVKILDEAFAAIDKAKANAEKNLQNSRELFDSYLNKVFAPSASVRLSSAEGSGQRNPGEDWEEKRLVEVCNILNGGTPKTGVKEYWDGNVKWITPKDMGKLTSKFVDDTPRKITSLGLQKSSAKVIPSNSLILSTRAPIGHLAINTSEMATNQGCRGITPSSEINVQYLYFFLSNSIDLLNSLGTGATFRELSAKALSSVKIPLPPIHIQAQITAKFNALSRDTKKLETIYQQKLADLEELKKSILQKAFGGQLTIDNG